MIKLKILSSALSLAVLCSASVANAESTVVGQLVASPSAVINAGSAQQVVGTQAMAYIEGDTITTGADANAAVSLTSGKASLVVAPNTVVQAEEGQAVTVETSVGSFELLSSSAVNAIASFENGEFSAISKSGLLTVTSQDGSVTSIDAGNAFVYNTQGATSLNVQAAGNHGNAVNTALIIGGIVVGTVIVGRKVFGLFFCALLLVMV